jgi:3',5'-cyclic AMP phosphodiesterase CpdA
VRLLAQLSDPHIVAPGRLLMGCIDAAALFAQAVHAVLRLQPAPAAVLVSGDLVENGVLAEYVHLRHLLAPLTMPVYLMPGNHDDVATLRRCFDDLAHLRPVAGRPELAEHVLYAVDLDGLRLIAVDTVVAGAGHGSLCEGRLRWLDETLAQEPRLPTLVALHHPPFDSGIAYMDALSLREGRAGLAAVLARHPQVERVTCGHLHRSALRRMGTTVAMTVPSTAHQIVPDLRTAGFGAYCFEPPGFAVHGVLGGTIVSHIMSSAAPGEAFAFED